MIALRVANIALTAILCVITIKWVLIFFKTDNVDQTSGKMRTTEKRAESETGLEPMADIRLFAPDKKPQPVSVMATSASSINIGDLELKGVFANEDNPSLSMAIILIDGSGEIPAQVGDEIKPGVVLSNVGADYTLLSYNGGLTRLGFPERPDVNISTQNKASERSDTINLQNKIKRKNTPAFMQ